MFGLGGIRSRLDSLERQVGRRDNYVTQEDFASFKRGIQNPTANATFQGIISQLQSTGEAEIRRLVAETFNQQFPALFKEAVASELDSFDLDGLVDEVDLLEVATKLSEKITELIRTDSEWREGFIAQLAKALAEGYEWGDVEQALADTLVERISVSFGSKES